MELARKHEDVKSVFSPLCFRRIFGWWGHIPIWDDDSNHFHILVVLNHEVDGPYGELSREIWSELGALHLPLSVLSCAEQSPPDSSDQLKGLHPLSTQHGRRFGKDASPTNQLLRCSINSITTAIQQPFNSHSTTNEVKAQQDPLTMGETPETIWLLIPCDISNGALFTRKKSSPQRVTRVIGGQGSSVDLSWSQKKQGISPRKLRNWQRQVGISPAKNTPRSSYISFRKKQVAGCTTWNSYTDLDSLKVMPVQHIPTAPSEVSGCAAQRDLMGDEALIYTFSKVVSSISDFVSWRPIWIHLVAWISRIFLGDTLARQVRWVSTMKTMSCTAATRRWQT